MAYTLLLSQTPALAYTSNPTILSSCRLIIKYSAARKQAALFLHTSLHIHGFEKVQTLSLMYQADNISSISIQPVTETLSPDQCKEIARHREPAAKILHLNLHAPCLLQCPPSARSLAPKPGHESSFRQLRDLARAVEARIVFDTNWIHEQHYAAFFRLTVRPDQLAGLPVNEPHASYHRDWTILVPAEVGHEAIAEDIGSEAPPQYSKAPPKRAASPSTPSPPRKYKRKPAFSPRTPSPALYPPSPTEKATSSAVSPKSQASPTTHHSPGIRQLFANAVESLLPEALRRIRETEKNTLEEQLPGALQKLSACILPALLARLFEVRSPVAKSQPQPKVDSRADPQSDTDADSKADHKADADTDISTLIATRIRHIAQEELAEMHFEASRDAVHALDEAADDRKADLNETKDEGIAELQSASEECLNTFQDVAAEVVKQMRETLEGHAEDIYLEVWDNISDLVTIKETMNDKVERRILMKEKQGSEKGKKRKRRLDAAALK